jgi:hypothetical protein
MLFDVLVKALVEAVLRGVEDNRVIGVEITILQQPKKILNAVNGGRSHRHDNTTDTP